MTSEKSIVHFSNESIQNAVIHFRLRDIDPDEIVNIYVEDYDGNVLVPNALVRGSDVHSLEALRNVLNSEGNVGFATVGRIRIHTVEGDSINIWRPRSHRSRNDLGAWRTEHVKPPTE